MEDSDGDSIRRIFKEVKGAADNWEEGLEKIPKGIVSQTNQDRSGTTRVGTITDKRKLNATISGPIRAKQGRPECIKAAKLGNNVKHLGTHIGKGIEANTWEPKHGLVGHFKEIVV